MTIHATPIDARYAVLFEPVKIGPKVAPNRFFAVPHATGHSPLMPNGSIGMRAMKAEGGWGTVCMQLSEIDPSSDISNLPIEKFWRQQRSYRITEGATEVMKMVIARHVLKTYG